MAGKIWRYCLKCKVAVVYFPEAFETKESASRELDIRMYEHQEHSCRTCKKEFATCKGNPEFGDCVGKDNVINCDKFTDRSFDVPCERR